MTRQEKIQQDIQFAQNRIALKEQYLPTLRQNVTDPVMVQRYLDGIKQEKQLIAKLEKKIAKA